MTELTYGQKLVGITFNPSNDEKVDKIKHALAYVIDEVNELDATTEEQYMVQQQAILKLLDAQMWSVKSLFTK